MEHNNNEFLEFLEKTWNQDRACIVCGESEWQVGNAPFRIESIDHLYGYPIFTVTCKNCGNTIFINPHIYESKKNVEKQKTYTKINDVIYPEKLAEVMFKD